jgi:DNA recombination protein RmuC
MHTLLPLLTALLGLLLGAALVWLLLAKRHGAQVDALRERLATATQDHAVLRERSDAERRAAADKLELLMQAKAELSHQFKTLSNEILEEKARRFAEQNGEALGQLLSPLRTQLAEFRTQVETVYVQEGKDRAALAEQVRLLADLHQMLSEDARNLTAALKGNTKAQGNWGELILERVLESAGLRKGHEYLVQESITREDGSRAQPDVVITLPESRRLVVDAKVSLTAYDEYVRADSDDARAVAGRRHLESIRGHIKGLSEKRYEALHGAQSPDFVIMFVPIESAFMVASVQDGDLFTHAWERNILLVTPSTLLFVLRIVAHLWRQEQQSRNAREIADRGAKLYDQLSRFVDELAETGRRLGQAQTAWDRAWHRLVTQKGNVIWQAEQLRALGIKPARAVPAALLEQAAPDDAEDDDAAAGAAGASVTPTEHDGARPSTAPETT